MGKLQQSERFQRSFTITSGGTLAVDNYKGTIHVTGTDTNQVVVDVHKRFEGSDSDRKWWMENIQINFRNDSSRVSVDVKYPNQYCVFCWNNRFMSRFWSAVRWRRWMFIDKASA